ncbi:MAG TPA: thioesterase family protein [Acidimicrobiia bacterium]|nr:thioesterase family protein [Acidimicrobiia bacterium]
MTEAYFTTDDGVWFRGTGYTRGPWDLNACHAGPPTALMVRALETLVPDKMLTRLSVEIARPIPMGGFRVETEWRKEGRAVTLTTARILDDERVYAVAEALHLRQIELETKTAPFDLPDFSAAVAGPFPITDTLHGDQAFPSSIEVRYDPAASLGKGGPTVMWMRTIVPLLDGEEPTGMQRLCPLADSGNGTSYNEYLDRVLFVNPDLLLSVHRHPQGEWLGARVVSHWGNNGIGMADAELFDTKGAVGRATQNLLLDPAG